MTPRASRRTVCILAAACLLTLAGAASPDAAPPAWPHLAERPNPMRAPGPRTGPTAPLGMPPHGGFHGVLAQSSHTAAQPLFLGLLSLYRQAFSSINGDQSDVAPVHTLYGVQAILAHGAVLGAVLTTGRLINEPGVLVTAPTLVENGRVFHYDPLDYNTYWFWPWLLPEAPLGPPGTPPDARPPIQTR